MKRTILAVIAGLVAWALVVSLLDRGLRMGLPGYAEAEPTMSFSFAMMVSRLAMAAVTSVVAGMVAALVAPGARYVPVVVGALTLAMFLPVHVSLWKLFPAWYHLSFLVPIVPLVMIGALLVNAWRRRPAAIRNGTASLS